MADAETIGYLFYKLVPKFPDIEFGAHLHTAPHNWREKIEAAFSSGCKRFDSAIKGFGGCPMAKDDLTGNMPTENLVKYFNDVNEDLGLDKEAFDRSVEMASSVFPLF